MHSSDEDIELCSVDWFGSIEPNSTLYKKTQKKSKNSEDFEYGLVRILI